MGSKTDDVGFRIKSSPKKITKIFEKESGEV